jgi:transcriptional regulator
MKQTDDKFDLPQGTLDLLIMRVIALGPIHGYAIAQRIQQISRDALQVQQGSLYPALHRLEYKKLLTARRKVSETGREAKFYELTARGREHLIAETEKSCSTIVASRGTQPVYGGKVAVSEGFYCGLKFVQ